MTEILPHYRKGISRRRKTRRPVENFFLEELERKAPKLPFVKARKRQKIIFNSMELSHKFDRIDSLCDATVDVYSGGAKIPSLLQPDPTVIQPRIKNFKLSFIFFFF